MNKKRLTALILSVIMLVTLLPSLAFAMSNPYSTPSWNPGSTSHPRVMFTSNDIPKIKANLADTTQNAQAAYYFNSIIDGRADISVSLSSSIDSNTGTNADFALEGKIEALALYYALYAGDATNGSKANDCANKAITLMQNYLSAYRCNTSNSMAYRNIGCTVFHASEVFDWCYNYSGFTQSKKDAMISSIENLVKNLDVWNSSANAPSSEGAITGHGSENQILRDLLAFGIATAGYTTSGGSSRNDIYNAVMGRIQAEYIEPRNYMYKSNTTHQGSEYGWYRFYFDLYAEKLYETAASQSNTPPKTLFSTDDMKEVLYGMIYSRRADGRFFAEGDNKHTDWWYYNNFNQQTAKFAGDLFKNQYFKGEYRMMRGSEGTATDLSSNVFSSNQNFYDNRSFNAVQWLIMNDPSVPFTIGTGGGRNPLPKSRYFGSPIGKIYATTDWTYQQGKNTTFSSGAVSCEMKIGEQYSANHDHLDAGTFQLFYKGLLTGDYGAEGDYGTSYDGNYYKRTVAHNAITINNGSTGFSYDSFTFPTLYNDGGQLGGVETSAFSTWKNNAPYKRATVINHSIADDNSYSYIKGDITAAYGSKASEVARSMAFLPTGNVSAPAVMVVYDKVKSSSSSYDKKFLMHLAAEPTVTNNNKVVSDNTKTLAYTNANVTYNGRLTVNTLLPKSATITKRSAGYVSASNKTYEVPSAVSASKFEPEWGYVEIAPTSASDTAYFLNVLTVSDAGTTVTDATLIEGNGLVGTKTGYGQVAMFANTGKNSLSTTSSASFTVSGGDTDLNYFIFGLGEGRWTVLKGDERIGTYAVTQDGGTISFKADAGNFTIRKYDTDDLKYNTVAWYDYRKTDGSSSSNSVSVWKDLSNSSNDWTIPISAGQTFWNGSGDSFALRIIGNNSNVTSLPSAVKDVINSGKFTLEFAVSNMNAAEGDLVSIFGNPRYNFAIYKIMAANKVYVKTPDTKTFINRPYWRLWNNQDNTIFGLNNHHAIITVDTNANGGNGELKLYLDGGLITSSKYSKANSMDAINLVSETGKRVDYKQIKVLNYAISADEAQDEYNAYKEGTF